jgi:hypothetical protein
VAVRLVVEDSIGPIAEIENFKGAVPRIGETVYVPVAMEPFSEPMVVKDVRHDFLAPMTRTRPGDRRWASKTQTVVVQL